MTAPEPREDVAVAEDMLDAAILAVVDIESTSPDPSVEEYARAVLTALAPLIAERVRAAAVEALRDESAVAEVGLTDAEWTRLRHAAGNRGDLGPIAEEVERILGERVAKAAVEALREAADEIDASVGSEPVLMHVVDWVDGVEYAARRVRDRADRRAER